MALTATSFMNANGQGQAKKTGINYLSSTAVSRLNAQNRNDAIKAQEAQSYNNGGLWGGLNYLSEKLATGFMSSIEGIWDYTAGGLAKLFGADDWAEKQFANDWFGDWYSSPDEWYNPSKGWQTAGDIAGGIGTSLPSIVAVVGGAAITAASGGSLSPLGAGLISAGVAGLGAAGNATKQAYRETGQLTGKEFGYGALVGVTEGGIEGVSNALSMGTAQIVKSATKAFAKETAKTVAKQSVIKTLGKGFIGEAFEEGVSEILDPYWQRLTYNPEAKNATAQEIAYAAFVGGMSGLIMNGFDVSIDSGNSFIKGNNIVNKGLDSEVIGLSEQLSAFEDINHTGDETFEGLSETFKKLSESLKMTGGKVSTVTQKKLLGDLQRANTAAIFKPMIFKSAANIVNNAEAIATRLTEYGYKTASGKPITFTAEQIRSGVDPKKPKSLSQALKNNEILRTLAVADATGHLVMDTAKFEQAALAGKRLASQVDLNRFVETATPAEIKSVSEALKIDNWATLDADTFNQKITEFVESGGVQAQANRRTLISEIQALPAENSRPIPKMVNLRQDGPVRYSDGKTDIAISKQGDTYTVFDYASGNLSKNMTRSEVNKLLRDYNVQQADITAAARAQTEEANKLRLQAAELDIFARDNIADYNKLSSPNQSMIRKVIREGRANGLSDGDVLAYAKISAHSGIDIVFNKNANYTGKNSKGEDTYSDGFYEREKNRIVVNPEGKRGADRLLLHELEHSIIKGKDGKKLIATAFRNTDESTRNKIIKKYGDFYKGSGLTATDKINIMNDEISARYAEDVLSNRNTLEKLLEAEPAMEDKILSFFKGAAADYADVPKLSRAAKRYYNTYKKLFDGFSAINQQNNAIEPLNNKYGSYDNKNGVSDNVRTTNDEKAQVSEREYAITEPFTDENGTTFKNAVLLDTTFFDGLSPRNWGAKLKGYVENRSENNPFILQIIDENGQTQELVFAKKSDYVKKYDGSYHKALSELYATPDNISKLATIHVDEVIEVSEENNPYYSSENSHGWFDKNGWLHRNANVINAKTGAIYNVTIDIAKTEDGRIVLYATKGKIKKVGQAKVNSLKIRGSTPYSNSKSIISQNNQKINTSTQKSSKTTQKQRALPLDSSDGKYLDAVERRDMKAAQEMVDAAAKKAGYTVKGLHATNAEFNSFDINKTSAENFHGKGIYFTNSVRDLENNYENYEGPDPWQKIEGRAYELVYDKYGISYEDTLTSDSEIIDKLNECYDIAIEEFKKSGRRITAYLRFDNPLILEKGMQITKDYSGYDGIIDKQVYENIGHSGMDENTVHYVVFNPNNIKSADPVTYDDNGKVIPLSERFNPKNNDIRYALNFNDDDFAVKKKEVSYAEPDKVTMSKGALQKKNADYKSDKTYSRKNVAASLEEIELFKSLPSAIRNDYINAIWNGLNSQFSESKREAFIDVKSKQLYQTFLNETHLLDNLDRTETDKISDNIVLALRKILDKGTPSVRAKLEAEFNTSDAGFWKKQYNEATERNRVIGQLMSKAQQMKDLKLGTFANITQHHSEIFKNSIEQLSRIQWRGNLSVKATRKVLEDLKKWYTSKDVKEGLLAYTNELSPGIYVSGVADTLEALTENQGGFSVDELKMLLDVMSYFTNFVEKWGKVFLAGKWVEAKSEAQRYIDILHANEKIKGGITLKFSGTAYTQMFGDPMTVARRMDMYESGFYTEIMTELRNAAVDAQVAEMEIRKSYDEFLDKNKKYVEKASSETVQYLGADIPRIQLIGLYMTMKRRHSWAGLAENGFTFTDVKGNKVRVNGSMGPGDTRITDAELTEHMKKRVAAVEELLTDTDKQYIAILEQAFNVEARKLKADRDMQRLGFTNATNDYYYPIRRANTAKNVDTSVTSERDRVSNSSFNMDTVKGAKQELLIESADAVFNRHIHAVCQYAYLSPAIEAYNVLYNMDVSGKPNKPINIRTESENTWKRGNEYFMKLIADIQGIPATSGEGQEVLAFIRGGYAKYQLGANPKVWLTQLSSIFASSSMLDADSITRGMTISAKGVDEYCSIAKLRNYDNTAAMAQGVLDTKAKRAVSAIGKFSDALMIPIGKMDRFVVCRTFGACQAQVEKNGGAKVGTEENKVEAGKLLRQVILETQQNSVATERSAMMRSGNEIWRTFTMFSADSMKVIGRVIDGYGEVSVLRAKLNATNDAASKTELKSRLKNAHKKTRKSVAALLTSAAFMAGVAQLFRHIYDKEQKEDESVLETMVADFGGNLIGGLPLFRDLYSRFVDGYAAENYAYSAFNDLLDSSINLFDAAKNIMSGEGTAQERNLAIRNITYSAGQLFGVPTRNMYNMLYGLTKRFSPETAYAIDGAFYAKNYQNDLYRAIESDDDEKATYILGLLMGERMNEDMDATVFNEILTLSKNGQKVIPRSIPSSITIDDTEYMLSEAEQAQIKSVYAGAEKALKTLFSKPKYNSLSDEQKAAAIDYVYDIYYQKALADTFGDERNAKSFLISDLVGAENLALLSIGTKGLESDVDPNGNVISGSKRKKVVAAINSLNISIDKKLLLICVKGYSLKDNDIRGMSAVKAKKRLLAYILQLKGVSKSEKTELAEMCGFEVKNGKIITKNTFNYNKLRPKAT